MRAGLGIGTLAALSLAAPLRRLPGGPSHQKLALQIDPPVTATSAPRGGGTFRSAY